MDNPYISVIAVISALILSACQSITMTKESPVTDLDNNIAMNIAKKEFPTVDFDYKTAVMADINCDKKIDLALLGYDKHNAYIMVVLGDLHSNAKQSTMAMGRGGQAHTYLCGMKAQLRVEDLIKPSEDEVGVLEGYKESKVCKGLNVSDGMCDAFHFYWNHVADSLSSWRR